jgi:hypothetical protein
MEVTFHEVRAHLDMASPSCLRLSELESVW